MNRIALIFAAAALATGCSQPPAQPGVLESAAQAMGGVDAVRGAGTLMIAGSGSVWWWGQELKAAGPLPHLQAPAFERRYDFAGHRMSSVTTMRVYGQDVKAAVGLDGDVAFYLDADGKPQRLGKPGVRGGVSSPVNLLHDALGQKTDYYHHPLPLLRAALEQAATPALRASPPRQVGGNDVVDLTTPDGTTLTLSVDRQTHLPVSISSRGDIANAGDVVITTSFGDYAQAGSLRLPQSISQKIDDHPATELRVRNTVGADVGDMAAPAAVASAQEPAIESPVVTPEKVARDIWLLRADFHHSLLVEMPSYLVLVDAPGNDAHMLAVIASARGLVPNKPLKYVVNTHHHFDHSGGLRAAVAEGMTMITHEMNRDYFEELMRRPHTIIPDHLARNAAPLRMETVSAAGKFELRDGNRTIEIYPVTGDRHDASSIMVYVPWEQLLAEVDVFSPGWVDGTEGNLLRNIRERGLKVRQIAALHSGIVPIKALEEAAVAKPNGEPLEPLAAQVGADPAAAVQKQ